MGKGGAEFSVDTEQAMGKDSVLAPAAKAQGQSRPSGNICGTELIWPEGALVVPRAVRRR